jgi:cytochrome c5
MSIVIPPVFSISPGRVPVASAAQLFRDSLRIAILPPLTNLFSSIFSELPVSKDESSDTQFFNSFSLVLGILIFFAIVLFGVARTVGNNTQREYVLLDPLHTKQVHENIAPFSKEAIAGQDNSALAALTAPKAEAADVPATGEAAFNKVCTTCHTAGVLGAPKVGDKAAWAPRIAQGKEALYKSAIGGKNSMPAKGGTTWPDATIRMTVDYMVSLSK